LVFKYDGSNLIEIFNDTGPDIYRADWSPDGAKALIVGLQNFVMEYNGNNFKILSSEDNDIRFFNVKWYKNSNYAILIGRYDSHNFDTDEAIIIKYDNIKNEFQNISVGGYKQLWAMDWDKNYQNLLMLGGGGCILNYDGNIITRKSKVTHNQLLDLKWKPDGSYALILGERGIVLKYDGNELVPIFENSSYYFSGLDWKPDGSYALIVGHFYNRTNDTNSGGVIFKYKNDEFELIYFNSTSYWAGFVDIGWCPNGSYALIIGNFGKILKYIEHDLMFIERISSNYCYWSDIAWKPNGAYAILLYGDSSYSKLFKYDGQDLIDLSKEYNYYGGQYIAWEPTGNYALLWGNYYIMKYNETSLTEINYDMFEAAGGAWKPDGSYMLFAGYAYFHGLKYNGETFSDVGLPIGGWELAWKPDGSYLLGVGWNGYLMKYTPSETPTSYDIDLTLAENDIKPSPSNPIEDENLKFNITIHNLGEDHIYNIFIQTFIDSNHYTLNYIYEIYPKSSQTTSITWLAVRGEHELKIKIDPFNTIKETNELNNEVTVTIDVMPKDTDNDGYPDYLDAFPYNSSEWLDSDNDGYGDNLDAFDNDPTQWQDLDGDGYGDNLTGNNPDIFPNDPSDWNDTDSDGIGDNSDPFPLDETQWQDSDGDGYGDNITGNNPDLFPA
ncbi:MAG: hypothetical protein KAJ51_16540, partial [Thermoplasmata archaeon]|nr:hypothetical protein [Thermoplasmata archaeon]